MEMRDDFILRIVKFIGDFLSSLLNGKTWDPKEIESISSEKIGLPYRTVVTMDVTSLEGILKINPDTCTIKIYLSAVLLFHEARQQESLGNKTEAAANYNKSLYLLKILEQIEHLTFKDDINKLTVMIQKKLAS